jgi:hypothetical protein
MSSGMLNRSGWDVKRISGIDCAKSGLATNSAAAAKTTAEDLFMIKFSKK